MIGNQERLTMPSFIDLTGQRFGRLTVLRRNGTNTDGRVLWLCLCDCGSESITSGKNLRKGRTRSCGCLYREKAVRLGKANTKHGQSGSNRTPEYVAYTNAKDRCTNPNNIGWSNYGGRGIRFMFESFERFLAELGPKPSPLHSIDRIDNNGHYESGNVRWATASEQVQNRRSWKWKKNMHIEETSALQVAA